MIMNKFTYWITKAITGLGLIMIIAGCSAKDSNKNNSHDESDQNVESAEAGTAISKTNPNEDSTEVLTDGETAEMSETEKDSTKIKASPNDERNDDESSEE